MTMAGLKNPPKELWISVHLGISKSALELSDRSNQLSCAVLIDQDESCRKELIERRRGEMYCPIHGCLSIFKYRRVAREKKK